MFLSSSHRYFPCHTDEFFSSQPADIVLLQCVRPAADSSGATLLALGSDVLDALEPADRDALEHLDFPAEFGRAPLLVRRKEKELLRFNPIELEHYELTGRQRHLVRSVVRAVESCQYSIDLARGDCLVVNNHLWLHGRAAFTPRSSRLLLRARVRVSPDVA